MAFHGNNLFGMNNRITIFDDKIKKKGSILVIQMLLSKINKRVKMQIGLRSFCLRDIFLWKFFLGLKLPYKFQNITILSFCIKISMLIVKQMTLASNILMVKSKIAMFWKFRGNFGSIKKLCGQNSSWARTFMENLHLNQKNIFALSLFSFIFACWLEKVVTVWAKFYVPVVMRLWVTTMMEVGIL